MRFVLAALTLAGCDDRGPRLTAVTPTAAPRGAQITLTGERLCGEPADCATAGGEVQVGLSLPAALATVIEYDSERAVIEVPAMAELGPSEIVVTVNDRASNALAFEVLGSSFAPDVDTSQ